MLRALSARCSLQDWSVRYGIAKAQDVAEVASVGGFVKQSNVVVEPNRLRSFGLPLLTFYCFMLFFAQANDCAGAQ